MTADPYGASAEFYDLTGQPVWDRKRPVLAAVLAAARPDLGPVLDIGAGTGLSTAVIAEALPGAGIVAVEPSAGMRIALATRVAATGLAARVTIVDGSVPGVALPERLGGAVCYGVLGHLAPEYRRCLWEQLAARLAPGAPAVLELMDRTAPPRRTPLRIAHTRVGEQDYEVWSAGEPTGPDTLRWTVTYRVLHRGTLRRELAVPLDWYPVGADRVRAETARAGLTCRQVAPDVLLLTRD